MSSNSTSLRKVTLQGDIKAQHGVGGKRVMPEDGRISGQVEMVGGLL